MATRSLCTSMQSFHHSKNLYGDCPKGLVLVGKVKGPVIN